MMNEERRPEVAIVQTLGPVYADKIVRIQMDDDTIYYSKAGSWVALTAVPMDHADTHENGGGDEIDVTGLSGLLADSQNPLAHKTSHQDGGSDEISVTGLAGLLADVQKVGVRKNSTGSVFTRQQINLIEGTNITLTVADDAGTPEVDVTINSTASTPSATTIGQVLFSVDGSTFTARTPLTSLDAGWLVDSSGVLLVT